ncbi:5E5 antigen-like [Vidua chalybeata]|uniref:5E5 antigen-like n=1 Tax=Vidua chalybeata TaxID=81927 RepID=UPI0023A87904|nr:5E5 antigen-like [Vidua chalybeata]
MAPGARRRQSGDRTIVTAGGGAGPAGAGDVIGCKQIEPGARAGGWVSARGRVPARGPPRAGARARTAGSRVRQGRGARASARRPRADFRARRRGQGAARGAGRRRGRAGSRASAAARCLRGARSHVSGGGGGRVSAPGPPHARAAAAARRRGRSRSREPVIGCARGRRRRRVCASLPFPGAQGCAAGTTQCPAVREPSAALPHACEPWPSDRGHAGVSGRGPQRRAKPFPGIRRPRALVPEHGEVFSQAASRASARALRGHPKTPRLALRAPHRTELLSQM